MEQALEKSPSHYPPLLKLRNKPRAPGLTCCREAGFQTPHRPPRPRPRFLNLNLNQTKTRNLTRRLSQHREGTQVPDGGRERATGCCYSAPGKDRTRHEKLKSPTRSQTNITIHSIPEGTKSCAISFTFVTYSARHRRGGDF
jgi:hypothetical protein